MTILPRITYWPPLHYFLHNYTIDQAVEVIINGNGNKPNWIRGPHSVIRLPNQTNYHEKAFYLFIYLFVCLFVYFDLWSLTISFLFIYLIVQPIMSTPCSVKFFFFFFFFFLKKEKNRNVMFCNCCLFVVVVHLRNIYMYFFLLLLLLRTV